MILTPNSIESSLNDTKPCSQVSNIKQQSRRNKYCLCDKCKSYNGKGSTVYPCTYKDCGKTYKKPSLLRCHIYSHTGERPFVCNLCNKGYKRSDELRRHGKVHSDERNYPCDLCNRSFKRSDHLAKHKKTHDKQSPAIKLPEIQNNKDQNVVNSENNRINSTVQSNDINNNYLGVLSSQQGYVLPQHVSISSPSLIPSYNPSIAHSNVPYPFWYFNSGLNVST